MYHLIANEKKLLCSNQEKQTDPASSWRVEYSYSPFPEAAASSSFFVDFESNPSIMTIRKRGNHVGEKCPYIRNILRQALEGEKRNLRKVLNN